MVLGRQVRRQQSDGCQVHGSVREEIQDEREVPRGFRGLDPIPGRGLREPQHLCAVAEEAARPFTAIQLPGGELPEMREELDRRLTRSLRKRPQL